MNDFKHGDKVVVNGHPRTVIGGPYDENGVSRYVASDESGTLAFYDADRISAAPTADPRVEVVSNELSTEGSFYRLNMMERDAVARNIVAALDAMTPRIPQVGDRIRILKTGAEFAEVDAGDEFRISQLYNDTHIITDCDDTWYFTRDTQGTNWELI